MKYLIILSLWVINIQAIAQCTEDKLWNWDDPSNSNWYIYPQNAQTFVGAGSPFVNAVGAILPIADSKDYKASDGWMLLRKDFGCPSKQTKYPYFILYNKYRAILRVFLYNNINDLVSGTSVTISYNGNDVNAGGALNFTKPLVLSSNNYPMQHADVQDLGLCLGIRANQATWLLAEFAIAYDPKTPDFSNKFSIFFDAVVNHDINLEGVQKNYYDYTGSKSYQLSSKKSDKCANCGTGEFLANSAKALSSLPDGKKLKEGLGQFADGLPGDPNKDGTFIERFAKEVKDFSEGNLVGLMISLTGAGKVLDYTSKIYDFLSGGNSSQSSVSQDLQLTPTVMRSDIKLKGSVTTNLQVYEIAMQVPATNYTASGNLPYYDCPLGTGILSDEIIVERTILLPFKSTPDNPFCTYANLRLSGFRLKNYPIFMLNGAAGLQPEKVEVSLFAEFLDPKQFFNSSNGQEYYSMLESDDKKTIRWPCTEDINGVIVKDFNNPYYHFFKDGKFNIISQRDSTIYFNTPNGLDSGAVTIYLVATPFIDIKDAKHLGLHLPENSIVRSLKLRALMKPDNGGSPLIMVQNYAIDEVINLNTTSEIFSLNSSQLIPDHIIIEDETFTQSISIKGRQFIETRNNVVVDNSNTQTVFASVNEILLKPGFEVKAGSSFKAEIFSENFTPTVSTLITNFDCNTSAANRDYSLNDNFSLADYNSSFFEKEVQITYNSSMNAIRVEKSSYLLNSDDGINEPKSRLQILDMLGRVVFSDLILDEEANMVYLPQRLGQGMYLITYKQGTKSYSEKLIVSNGLN